MSKSKEKKTFSSLLESLLGLGKEKWNMMGLIFLDPLVGVH